MITNNVTLISIAARQIGYGNFTPFGRNVIKVRWFQTVSS